MINRIKKLFSSSQDASGQSEIVKHHPDELPLAAAALLVEAARLDEEYDEVERKAVLTVIQERFSLSNEECETLIEQAEIAQHEATDLYRFVKQFSVNYGQEERLKLIEMLWYVVYSDGELHPYESNLIQRIAGMLHVSDKERAEARQRVLAKGGN
jgi:uncharacterized tellurite resistance protein B-like protein